MTDRSKEGQTDRWKTHPYHAGKSCSKFGLILPSGLGGESVTDRGIRNIHITFF